MSQAPVFTRWFNELGLKDVPSVGGKNASLGELYRQLSASGVRVPNGFAITADGYRHFMHVTAGSTLRIQLRSRRSTRRIAGRRMTLLGISTLM